MVPLGQVADEVVGKSQPGLARFDPQDVDGGVEIDVAPVATDPGAGIADDGAQHLEVSPWRPRVVRAAPTHLPIIATPRRPRQSAGGANRSHAAVRGG